jgi:hypothetical protein
MLEDNKRRDELERMTDLEKKQQSISRVNASKLVV